MLMYHPVAKSIIELCEDGQSRVVASGITSDALGRQFAAAPKLFESTKLLRIALEWILTDINPQVLPAELRMVQPLLLSTNLLINQVENEPSPLQLDQKMDQKMDQ